MPWLLSPSLCRRTHSPYGSLHPQARLCTLAGPTVLVLDPSDSWWLSLWLWELPCRGRRQGDMAACCHMPARQCPQVTHWEGTATAGALGAEGRRGASHNPGKGSTASYEGWAGRRHDLESLGEPLQGSSSKLSKNKRVCPLLLSAAGSPAIACCPVPSPPAPWPGQS